MLGYSSAALLSIASTLLTTPTDEDKFGDLPCDEPMGLKPCSYSIDDFLVVRDPMPLVPKASQRFVIVQPHMCALLVEKTKNLMFRGAELFLLYFTVALYIIRWHSGGPSPLYFVSAHHMAM